MILIICKNNYFSLSPVIIIIISVVILYNYCFIFTFCVILTDIIL